MSLCEMFQYISIYIGVDAIIAQGSEGGGHSVRVGHGRGTLALAAAVTKELKGRNIEVIHLQSSKNFVSSLFFVSLTKVNLRLFVHPTICLLDNVPTCLVIQRPYLLLFCFFHDSLQVLCAGGFVDGRGLVAGLALGCSAVVMGTRFWACKEALGNPLIQQRLVTASGDETSTPIS